MFDMNRSRWVFALLAILQWIALNTAFIPHGHYFRVSTSLREKSNIAINAQKYSGKAPIIIEITTTEVQEATSNVGVANEVEKQAPSIVAYDSVYDDRRAEKIESIYESPRGFFLTLFSNPWYLLLTFYMGAVALNNKGNISRFFKTMFGVKTEPPPVKSVEEMPFQVFECERCGMQMRPAKGRAEAVFSRPNFRCARCGAKASSFFNIDDKDDPRAVEREKRLKEEAEEDFEDDGLEDD